MTDFDQVTLGPVALPGITDYFGVKPLWTPEIGRHMAIIAQNLACDFSGSMIYGLQHSGKTEFTKYLRDCLEAVMGSGIECFLLDFYDYKAKTVEELLRRSLVCIGNTAVATQSRTILQGRLVDDIFYRCKASQARRAVLVIDEAQNIPYTLIGVISAVASDLFAQKKIRCYVLSVAQPEMLQSVDLIQQTKSLIQLVGRYYQRIEEFHALSADDVKEFLENLDGTDRQFSLAHFPIHASTGWSTGVRGTNPC